MSICGRGTYLSTDPIFPNYLCSLELSHFIVLLFWCICLIYLFCLGLFISRCYYFVVVVMCAYVYASRPLFPFFFFVVLFGCGALLSFSVVVCFPVGFLPRVISCCCLFVCCFSLLI